LYIVNIFAVVLAGWEQGYREPNIDSIKKLCEIFEISADYLLGLSD
jgi:transcriptional regulator with XRE-family HTH domain